MTVIDLIEKLQKYANQLGGDCGYDEIAIWHDGSDAKLIITDCMDMNKQTFVMGDE